ncbi:MAG: GNAT family N-acetyltransferase [Methyloceanibacter sp.]|uniref:GNAT family N-acetyltransferase n=1 Tax=Methyloceanibacter sp. TaxID=1965321 RepID=UPI003D6D48F8
MTETHSADEAPRAAWRAMGMSDLAAVEAIAAAVHPTLPERPDVFAEKLTLFPQGCFALAGDGAVVGYAFAHPWRQGGVPKLDALLGGLPEDADCLFLHDVAVLPQARGQGASGALVALLVALAGARGLRALALAAVYGTGRHWARAGFTPAGGESIAAQLAPYGAGAQYMVRRLG